MTKVHEMTDEDWNNHANTLVGAGMLWAALVRWSNDAVGRSDCAVEIVPDDDGEATNVLLVKFDVGGPPSERGYLVTVTIPPEPTA